MDCWGTEVLTTSGEKHENCWQREISNGAICFLLCFLSPLILISWVTFAWLDLKQPHLMDPSVKFKRHETELQNRQSHWKCCDQRYDMFFPLRHSHTLGLPAQRLVSTGSYTHVLYSFCLSFFLDQQDLRLISNNPPRRKTTLRGMTIDPISRRLSTMMSALYGTKSSHSLILLCPIKLLWY